VNTMHPLSTSTPHALSHPSAVSVAGKYIKWIILMLTWIEMTRDDVYFNLPPGPSIPVTWRNSNGSTCKALYSMQQAPRLWNRRPTDWLNSQGFVASSKDPCLFTATCTAHLDASG
jgi:hypothetical protein